MNLIDYMKESSTIKDWNDRRAEVAEKLASNGMSPDAVAKWLATNIDKGLIRATKIPRTIRLRIAREIYKKPVA